MVSVTSPTDAKSVEGSQVHQRLDYASAGQMDVCLGGGGDCYVPCYVFHADVWADVAL